MGDRVIGQADPSSGGARPGFWDKVWKATHPPEYQKVKPKPGLFSGFGSLSSGSDSSSSSGLSGNKATGLREQRAEPITPMQKAEMDMDALVKQHANGEISFEEYEAKKREASDRYYNAQKEQRKAKNPKINPGDTSDAGVDNVMQKILDGTLSA